LGLIEAEEENKISQPAALSADVDDEKNKETVAELWAPNTPADQMYCEPWQFSGLTFT
jgi:hypothetical protein